MWRVWVFQNKPAPDQVRVGYICRRVGFGFSNPPKNPTSCLPNLCWHEILQNLFCCFTRWINLKVPFREVFGGVRCNLKEAVQMAGLAWQGRAHCGLDDAKNTARLLALLMRKGFRFSITNSMMCHQSNADYSLSWKQHQQPSDQNVPFSPHHPRKMKDPHILLPLVHFQPCCYCGVKSMKGTIRKPGPRQGSCFFGCGNYTSTRGARCHYFEWASP